MEKEVVPTCGRHLQDPTSLCLTDDIAKIGMVRGRGRVRRLH
jgi:hypothetical protein